MASNAIKYISNVGRSFGYATVDVIKDLNPTVASFAETNSETLKTTYQAIKNIKSTAKSLSEKAINSKYGELAKGAKNNLFEDLKTGKFYNKERIAAAEEKAANAMLGDEFDFGFDESDISFDDDGSEDFDNGDLMDMMDKVGEKTSTAISTVVARSAEYTVQATKEATAALYNQNAAIYANLHANMKTMNENLVNLVKFATGPVQTGLENSKNFYENETRLSQERNEILKEILELQKGFLAPTKSAGRSKDKITIMDIINSEGVPDLGQYAKRIKQNLKANDSGMSDMLQMITESGALETMLASPLEGITKAIVKGFVPRMMKDAMKTFNQSLSGFFTSMIANVNNMEDFGVKGMIKKIFGIEDSYSTKLDTSKYNKGAVPFDGITRKAIVEVIPTYLAQIASALNGGRETRYDYENGKFVNLKNIKRTRRNEREMDSRMTSADISEYANKYISSLGLNKRQQASFERDLEKILYESYREGKLFNPKGSRSASSYGLKGGKASDVNYEIIRAMFNRMPPHLRLQWATEMFSTKERSSSRARSREESGIDLMNALYNGSIEEKSSTSKVSAAPGKGGSIFTSIYYEINAIRRILEGSYDGKLSRSKPGKASSSETKNKYKKVRRNMKSSSIDEGIYGLSGDAIQDYVNRKMNQADSSTTTSEENTDREETGLDRMKARGKKIIDFISRPFESVTKIMKIAENRMIDMVFGDASKKGKWQEEIEKHGLAGAILNRFDGLFQKFGDWVDKKIFEPLSKRLEGGQLGEKLKSFSNRIGLTKVVNRVRSSDAFGRFTSAIRGIGKDAKNLVLDNAEELQLGRKLNAAGERKKGAVQAANDILKNIAGGGRVENAASGIKRVARTGVVAVSKGELIIPESLNPYAIKRNLINENRAKSKFSDALGIPNYAEGGEVDHTNFTIYDKFVEKNIDNPDKIRAFVERNRKKSSDKDEKISKSGKSAISGITAALNRFTNNTDYEKSDYEEGRDKTIIGKSIDELGKAIHTLAGWIKGIIPKKGDEEKTKESFLSTAFTEIKKYAPEVGAGAVVGAGVSFLPGVIGGPILGASVGAGLMLIKNSEKIQEGLFGKKDEKGEYSGGLLSKELSNNIHKYLPNIGKGAILGGITSILPFVPGGPVAGIILGSAAGFAASNDKIREKLFGDEGLLGKNFKEKVVKVLPKMGAGAIAGLVAGPFGIGTNLLLGSAIGFATTTDTFKDTFFGKEDKEGNRDGGIFKLMTEHVIDPLKEFATDTKDKMGTWVDMYIKQPLKDAADPLKKQFQLMFQSMTGFFKDAIDRIMSDNVGSPMEKFLRDKLFKPATNVFKGFLKGLSAPVKTIAKAPFSLIGAVGDHYRTKQIKSGDADYMSAQERLLYRRFNKGINPFKWSGSGADYDKQIYQMDETQLRDTLSILQDMQEADLSFDKKRNARDLTAFKDFDTNVRKNSNLTHKDTKKITNQIRKVIRGSKTPEQAQQKVSKYIASLNGLTDAQRKNVMDAANNYLASFAELGERQAEAGKYKSDIMNKLRGTLDIKSEEDIPMLIRYLQKEVGDIDKRESAEEEMKSPEEKINEAEDLRHSETINELQRIVGYLKALNEPDPDRRAEIIDEFSKKSKKVDDANAAKRLRKNRKEEQKKKEREEKIKAKEEKERNKFAKKRRWRDKNLDPLTGRPFGEDLDADDIETDGIKVDGLQGRLQNAKQKAKSAFYTFVNGKPIRYIRDRVGKLTQDLSDSDTRKTVDEIEEKEEKQEGIISSILGAAGGVLGKAKNKLFGSSDSEDEEGEEKDDGIISKVLSFFSGSKGAKVATAAGVAVGAPLLVGLWTDTIWPALEPILSPIGENLKNLGQNLWDKAKAWFEGDVPGKDGYSGGMPGLLERLAKHWASGFETIMTKVIPKAVEIFISVLPMALANLGKGIIKGLTMSLDNILNAGRPSTNSDDYMDEYTVVDSSNFSTLTAKNEDISTKGMDFSAWDTSSTAISKLLKVTSTGTGGTVDQSGNNLVTYSTATDSNGNPITTDTSTIKQGSNVYTVNNNTTYTDQNGNTMTAEQLLQSDQIVGYVADENGNTIPVTGQDLLEYPELAEALGIDHRRLTEEEKQANTDAMGLSNDRSFIKGLAHAGGWSFLRGNVSGGERISKIGSRVAKGKGFKLLRGAIGGSMNLAGKGVSAAGRLGQKYLPSWMTQKAWSTTAEEGAEAATEAAGKASGKAAANTAMNAAQEAAEDMVVNPFTGEKMTRAQAVAQGLSEEAGDFYTMADDAVEAAGKASNKGASSTALSVITNQADDITLDAADAMADGAAATAARNINDKTNKGLISKFVEFIKDRVVALFKKNEVVDYIFKASKEAGGKTSKKAAKEAAEKVGKELAEKLAKKMPNVLAKASGKVVAKLGTIIGTGGVALVVQALIAFRNGWKNANQYIGVLSDVSEATSLTKLVCAIVNTLNEVFCLGLIDIGLIFDMVFGVLNQIPIFQPYLDKIEADREQSGEMTAEANEQMGTNMDVRELEQARQRYESKNFITKSAPWEYLFGKKAEVSYDEETGEYKLVQEAKKGKVQEIGGNIKNFIFGNEETGEKNLIGKIGGGLSSLKEGAGNFFGNIREGAGNLLDSAKENGKNAFNFFTGNAFNDDAIREKLGVSDEYQVTGLDRVSSFFGEQIGRLFGDDFTTEIAGTVTKIQEGANAALDGLNNKMGAIFGLEDESGNPMSLTEGISYNFTNTINNLKQGWNNFTDKASEFWKGVGDTASTAWNSLTDGISNGVKTVNNSLGSLLGFEDEEGNPLSLTDGVAQEWGDIRDGFLKGWRSLRNKGKEFWDDISSKASERFKEWREGIGDALSEVNKNLGSMFGMVDEDGNPMSLTEGIKYNWDKFRDGLTDTWNNIKDGAKGLWDRVTGWFSDAGKDYQENARSRDPGASGSGLPIKRYAGGASGNVQNVNSANVSSAEKRNGTFISQLDYKNKRFNTNADTSTQTLADSGCAPASAAMVINSFRNADTRQMTMDQASKAALNYKNKNSGVTADYFGDTFTAKGLKSRYIIDDDPSKRASNIATSLYNQNKVVIMGQDRYNRSKEDSPFGPKPHYVVATRMSDDGKYIYINDPESNRAEIAYPASKVLGSAQMAIAATAASGSGLSNRSMRRYLRRYAGMGSYGPDTIQYKVWQGLRGAGYSEIATAAAMGNIQHESGFDPATIEGGSGIGFGLVQWSYGRRTAMENYARSKGKNPSDVGVQIEYLLQELAEGSGIWTNANSAYGFGTLTRNDWANGNDLDKATKAFMCCFERPSYNASINHIDRRLQSAREYYEAFTGTPVTGASGDSESGGIFNTILDSLNAFDDLAAAYGLTSKSDDSSSSSGGVTGGNDKQQALVAKMKSVEGKLAYSQSQRNPDYGSGDCSSTVQWAYKNVLGVDPGSWTGAQETDSDLYTVANDVNDPSKLQPGDLILYRKGGRSTHVEMYAGNNQMIGHGGGSNGTTPGPTVKNLMQNMGSQSVAMVRRWVGFQNGGSGSGLYMNGGLSRDELKKVRSSEWIINNQDKISDKDISKYKEEQIDRQVAAKYSARGTAPGRQGSTITTTKPTQTVQVVNPVANRPANGVGNSDTLQAMMSMVSLLSQVVDNTAVLQTMVAILSQIMTLMNEENKLRASNANQQRLQDLQRQKAQLFTQLGSLSNPENKSVEKLVKDAERLAKS